MRVIIAGLETRAVLAYMGEAFPLQYNVQWNEVEEFLARAQEEADEENTRWVWLYRAPWTLPMDTAAKRPGADIMRQWQSRQHRVLQLHRYLRNRLVLVNVNRVNSWDLAQRLGIETSESLSSDDKLLVTSPMTAVLRTLFEQIAPEYWTLYEALEAAAWLPQGEPESRSAQSPSAEGLEQLLDVLCAGQQMPQVLQRLQQAERREQRAIEDSNASRQAVFAAEATCQALTEARQHLEAQLHDATQQLQQTQGQTQQLVEELDAARRLAAQSEQNCTQMEKELDTLRTRLVDSESHARAVGEENEVLLTQLHQVQEELEKYYLDGVAMKETHAKLSQQLHQTSVLQKQLAQERDEAQKAVARSADECRKLTELAAHLKKQNAEDVKRLEQAIVIQKQFLQERDATRKSAAQAEALRVKMLDEQTHLQQKLSKANSVAKAAQDESELLLGQLHKVQEELESYYLANRHILTVMAQSETAMDRACKILIRLAHG